MMSFPHRTNHPSIQKTSGRRSFQFDSDDPSAQTYGACGREAAGFDSDCLFSFSADSSVSEEGRFFVVVAKSNDDCSRHPVISPRNPSPPSISIDSGKKYTMKTPRAVSVLFVAAVLVVGASAGQASAGGVSGWGSAGCCGGGGYGYGGCGYGGCGAQVYGGYSVYGYGGCGPGGCGLCAVGGNAFWIVGDYAPYIIGHGPMFPAGNFSPAYSYTAPAAPDVSVGPKRP
jgi:hypothetical protein